MKRLAKDPLWLDQNKTEISSLVGAVIIRAVKAQQRAERTREPGHMTEAARMVDALIAIRDTSWDALNLE